MSDHSVAPDGTGSGPTPGHVPPPAALQPAYPVLPPGGYDPLIGLVSEGVGGWINRISEMFRRSWRPLLAIFALTQALPTIVLGTAGAIGASIVYDKLDSALPDDLARVNFASVARIGAPIVLGALLVFLIVLTSRALGYGAATYAATRKAIGIPVTVGEALRYGVRRCRGLAGWLLLIGLIFVVLMVVLLSGATALIKDEMHQGSGYDNGSGGLVLATVLIAGLVACYLLALAAMVGPAYLFERGNVLARAFRLLHGGFGMVVGRLLLLALVAVAAGVLTSKLEGVGPQIGVASYSAQLAVGVAILVVVALVELPFTVVQFAGVLLTYASRRADHRMISSTDLVTELDGWPRTSAPIGQTLG